MKFFIKLYTVGECIRLLALFERLVLISQLIPSKKLNNLLFLLEFPMTTARDIIRDALPKRFELRTVPLHLRVYIFGLTTQGGT